MFCVLALGVALVAAPLAHATALDGPPLTLDAVVSAVLANNPEASLLRNSVKGAELDTFAAQSVYQPKLYSAFNSFDRSGAELGTTYEAGITKLLHSGSRVGIGLLNSRYGASTLSELKLTYTLPFFGTRDREALLAVEEAKLGESAQSRALRAGLEDLLLRTVAAYYEVVLAKDSEIVADAAADSAKALYRVARIRAGTDGDGAMALRHAALQVQQSEFAVRQAEQRRTTAATQLRMLAGFTPGTPLPIVQNVPEIAPDANPEPIDQLVDFALVHRADLINLRNELGALERRVNLAHHRFLAPVEVTLQVSMTGDGSGLDNALDLNDPQFGVGMAMALGDRRERDIVSRRLDLELENHRYALAHLEASVRAEVEQAYYQLEDCRAQALLAGRQTTLAGEELEQTQLKFRAGLTDVQNALDRQQALVDARFRYLDSRAQYTVARFRLDKTIGRMPERWTQAIE